MRTKTIRQTLNFKAKPIEVYEILMDEDKHATITDSEVSMSRKVKGKFTAFGGYCHGHNIELEEGSKIVQGWNFDEHEWPEEHFSICTFLFEKTPDGTKLTFTQKGVPAHKYEDIKKGWHDYYWTPMKAFIEQGNHKL
jgi:activator of HSP90 ATPase